MRIAAQMLFEMVVEWKSSHFFRNENEKLLRKYVYDGPVNHPQFFDQQYQERIQRLTFEIDQIEKELKMLKTDYQQNINEPKVNVVEILLRIVKVHIVNHSESHPLHTFINEYFE